MLYLDVQSTTRPVLVVLETLPDGEKIVRLRDNISEIVAPKENDEPAIAEYAYDEVVFPLPYDRDETVSTITAAFSDWWAYGVAHTVADDFPPTFEQRLDALENMMISLLAM